MSYLLYRAVRRRYAGLGDFWSAFALGEEPFPIQLREPLMWAGISMLNDRAHAQRRAIALGQGRFLAELYIPDEADVLVMQTGTRDLTHHSVMGTPHTLLSLVVQVLPITDEGTP